MPNRRPDSDSLDDVVPSPGVIKQFRIKCHSRIRSTSLSVISFFVRSYSFVVRGDSCPAICWACEFFELTKCGVARGINADEWPKEKVPFHQ